jgi:hypothetical protein
MFLNLLMILINGVFRATIICVPDATPPLIARKWHLQRFHSLSAIFPYQTLALRFYGDLTKLFASAA